MKNNSTLKVFLEATRGVRQRLVLLTVMMTLTSLIEIGVTTLGMSWLIRRFINDGTFALTSGVFTALGAALLIDVTTQGFRTPFRDYCSSKIRRQLADKLVDSARELAKDESHGSIASEASSLLDAVVAIVEVITGQATRAISGICVIITILVVMAPELALVCIGALVGFSVIVLMTSRKFIEVRKSYAKAKAHELELFAAVFTVGVSWTINKLRPLRSEATWRVSRASRQHSWIFTIRTVGYKLCIHSIFLICFATTAVQLLNGSLELSEAYIVLTSMGLTGTYLWILSLTITELAEAIGHAKPMAQRLAVLPPRKPPSPKWLPNTSIKLQNVFVDYISSGHRFIFNYELFASGEQFVVLAGENGSGKSTLIKIIVQGIHCSGNVLVETVEGPVDLLKFDAENQVVYVPQDFEKIKEPVASLFDIPYTEKEQADPQCWLSYNDAFKRLETMAGAKEHAQKFGETLRVVLMYERDLNFLQPIGTLSGGQRQRINIAAALFEMLMLLEEGYETVLGVFDEATGAISADEMAVIEGRIVGFARRYPCLRFIFTEHRNLGGFENKQEIRLGSRDVP